MLRIETRKSEVREEPAPTRNHDGDGVMFLAVLSASWIIAIAVGWAVWRMAPL